MTTTQQKPTKTQNETVKAHLLTGQSISTWQAYELYHITCLAQRIHELRSVGLSIKSELVTQKGKRYSEYWLDADTIKSYQSQTNNNHSQTTLEGPKS